MKVIHLLVGAIAMVLLVAVARGDIVHLKNGDRLEGDVEIKGETAVVTNKYGSTSVSLDAIKMIEDSTTVVEKYNKLNSKAQPDSLDEQRALANYCRENYLPIKEKFHLLLILRLRPGDIQARSRLGYVMLNGRWFTKQDEMYSRGLTHFRGGWVTPEDKQKMLSEERELRLQLAAKRKEKREKRLAELKARRLAQARKERSSQRSSADILRLSYVDSSYYNPQRYMQPYGRYSVFDPYYGGAIYPYAGQSWYWYRRWTGAGLSRDYRARSWRVRW